MTGNILFDHEKSDVYQVGLQVTVSIYEVAKSLDGIHRHLRDQMLRSAQSIPLNIAEGNGKRSTYDRSRFFEIARGSAMETAAALDILISAGICSAGELQSLKENLIRIVSMLSKMADLNQSMKTRLR
jgi:four helix bundle protein